MLPTGCPCILIPDPFLPGMGTAEPARLATCGHLILVISQTIMVDFHSISLRVDRRDIYYIHYIVEGYDGLGTVSTLDSARGIVLVTYPESSRNDLFDLIGALETERVIKEVMQ